MEKTVKVVITYDNGYEKRFTDGCLAVLRRSREAKAAARRTPQDQKETKKSLEAQMEAGGY